MRTSPLANLVTIPAMAMLFSALAFSGPRPCLAQEFRIETDVFVGEQKEPVVETLTVFSNGVVYDFLLTGVEEITLFDRARNRLVLMDTQREVKTELTTDSIISFVAGMKSRMTDEQREFLLSDASETSETDDGALLLSNGRVRYRAECVEPKQKSMAIAYQRFADWYARLNAMRGNLAPFLRIELNQAIAERGLIPKTIERTIIDSSLSGEKKIVARSRHLANWRLSNTDRKWIDRAATCLTTYRAVPFREYVQLSDVAGGSE